MVDQYRACTLANNGFYSALPDTAWPCSGDKVGKIIVKIGLFSNKYLLGAVVLTFILQMATVYVPLLNPIFRTEPLTLNELLFTLALSSVVFIAVEIEKMVKRKNTVL
jgi:magnesium-transporting ATPase (P-type)